MPREKISAKSKMPAIRLKNRRRWKVLNLLSLVRHRFQSSRREEEGLARRVEFELYAANAFDMNAIEVTARDGNVTLDGHVASQAELILADNIVRTVEGVRTVNNHLKVSKAA